MMNSELEIIANPDEPTILSRRVINAPRALVWDLFTKAEHLKRWWGPRWLTMVSCEVDLRVGGSYRFVLRAPDGLECSFRGEYHEIIPQEKVVNTFVFEPLPDQGALQTLTMEEVHGRTIVSTITLHQSVANRDGHLASGMEAGMRDTYARLDELLAELQNQTSV